MSELKMKYFVLKPKGTGPYARASRAAMFEYAKMIKNENPQLADELHKWTMKEWEADHLGHHPGTKLAD